MNGIAIPFSFQCFLLRCDILSTFKTGQSEGSEREGKAFQAKTHFL